MRRKMKSRRFPTIAKLGLASWVIFSSLLPWQSGYAAMSCLWSANVMMCHCGNNCLRSHNKPPDVSGIVHSPMGQSGIPHPVPEAMVIGNANNSELPCGLVCSLRFPTGETRFLTPQQQIVTEACADVQNPGVISFMPCCQPTSHGPPQSRRSLPFYIFFSSLLI